MCGCWGTTHWLNIRQACVQSVHQLEKSLLLSAPVRDQRELHPLVHRLQHLQPPQPQPTVVSAMLLTTFLIFILTEIWTLKRFDPCVIRWIGDTQGDGVCNLLFNFAMLPERFTKRSEKFPRRSNFWVTMSTCSGQSRNWDTPSQWSMIN